MLLFFILFILCPQAQSVVLLDCVIQCQTVPERLFKNEIQVEVIKVCLEETHKVHHKLDVTGNDIITFSKFTVSH